MWDRLFGRSKNESPEPACVACGRTLLPGEWAQTVVGDDGYEAVICSLCAQGSLVTGATAPLDPEPTPAQQQPIPVSGRPQPIRPRQTTEADRASAPRTPPGEHAGSRDNREESDAFWRALKEKDDEISRLRSELARSEAEVQELAAQVSLLQRQLRGEAVTDWQVAAPFDEPAAESGLSTLESAIGAATQPFELEAQASIDLEERAGEQVSDPLLPAQEPVLLTETPAEQPASKGQPREESDAVSGDLRTDDDEQTAAIPAPAGVRSGGALGDEPEGPSWLFDAPPHQTFGDSRPPQQATEQPSEQQDEPEAGTPPPPPNAEELPPLFSSAPAPVPLPSEASEEAEEEQYPEPDPEELAAEAAALPLLQRGADVLNVSTAPAKIAETSESLGVPMVHLSSDGAVMRAVFLWSMAWYEYEAHLQTGEVTLVERGYDERPELRPNAKVRADGTVQVAPLPTRRPARPGQQVVSEPDVQPAIPGKGDIISKSLKGQRTDDEPKAWDQMAARDFDWGR